MESTSDAAVPSTPAPPAATKISCTCCSSKWQRLVLLRLRRLQLWLLQLLFRLLILLLLLCLLLLLFRLLLIMRLQVWRWQLLFRLPMLLLLPCVLLLLFRLLLIMRLVLPWLVWWRRRLLLLWLPIITGVLLLHLLSFESLRMQGMCNIYNTTALPCTQWDHVRHIMWLQLLELGRRQHLKVPERACCTTSNPLPISRHLPHVRGSRPLQSRQPGVRQQGPLKWRPLRPGSTHSTYGLGRQLLKLVR
jgi:hypothetical protein